MNNLNISYKKNENFVYRKVLDEAIIVPIKNNVGDMEAVFTLNETGVVIWENIEEGITLQNILEIIIDEFDIQKVDAEKDLLDFIDQLIEAGAVVIKG